MSTAEASLHPADSQPSVSIANRGFSYRNMLLIGFLLAATFCLYASTLHFQFVWDDVVYVTQNYRVQGLSGPRLRAIWTKTYLGHYAPIQHTFLAIVHHFAGLE